MGKDAYYFSHDSNASQDPKILQMCSVYKAEGYGWYWMLIEMMREQENYKLSIEGKYAFNSLAVRLYTDTDTFVSFINDCVSEFKLFCRDGKYLWSESLLRRMKMKEEKSKKARKSVLARWEKAQENTNVQNNDTNVSKNDAIKESKRKESKVKESSSSSSENKSENYDEKPLPQKETPENFYNNNFGLVNSFISESINHWLNDGVEEELIIEYMKKAVSRGPDKSNWAYVEKIIKENFKLNIKTLEQYRVYEAQRVRDRQDKNNKPTAKDIRDTWK